MIDSGGRRRLPTAAQEAQALSEQEEEEERERKKKKNEKKVEIRAQKAKEQTEKQATWQKFAKKSERKGIHIAGTSGTSIFKTPDNPLGKGDCSSTHSAPTDKSLTMSSVLVQSV